MGRPTTESRRVRLTAEDPSIHTNTVEGTFKHLQAGDEEASISTVRPSTCTATSPSSISGTPNRVALGVDDVARTDAALRGGPSGKRLTYRRTRAVVPGGQTQGGLVTSAGGRSRTGASLLPQTDSWNSYSATHGLTGEGRHPFDGPERDR